MIIIPGLLLLLLMIDQKTRIWAANSLAMIENGSLLIKSNTNNYENNIAVKEVEDAGNGVYAN